MACVRLIDLKRLFFAAHHRTQRGLQFAILRQLPVKVNYHITRQVQPGSYTASLHKDNSFQHTQYPLYVHLSELTDIDESYLLYLSDTQLQALIGRSH